MPSQSVTPLEEIEGWARRMIDQVEDFDHIKTAADFRTFVDDNAIGDSLSASETRRNRQLRALERGRESLKEFQAMVGVKKTVDKQTFTYKTGRMAGKTVTRRQVHYRDYETNQFVKFNKQRYDQRIIEIRLGLEALEADEKRKSSR